MPYFNPRSPCGERLQPPRKLRIHQTHFNPRSPCGERRRRLSHLPLRTGFQSTLSLRRATARSGAAPFPPRDFNPRSPCGERLRHAVQQVRQPRFQSTLSLRRATRGPPRRCTDLPNFNPRSPCGERPGEIVMERLEALFQSTLSLRRATYSHRPGASFLDFNPRSPCGERPGTTIGQNTASDFNPRSPCGERQQIPPNWPYRFCLKCQFKDGEKSKKAKGSASAQASSPAYEKNKVRIPWGDFECFRFAPIK